MTDVFGQALKGYLKGDLSQYVIRGKDGNDEKINIDTFFTSYFDWEDYEKTLIANHAEGRILDIGAGAGRHSLFLQDRGFDVHAIDNSPQAVRLMEIRGLKKVYLMDLRKINFPPEYFDTALIMFNDLGLAGTIKNTVKLLKKLFTMTKPTGKVIVTLRNPLAGNSSSELMEKIKIRMEYNDAIGNWFNSIMVSPDELKNLIRDTGWFVTDIIEGKDGFYGAVLKKSLGLIRLKVNVL